MPGGKHSEETRSLVRAVLLAGGRIEDAAKAGRCDPSTVRKWKLEPEFAAKLAEARREIEDARQARIEDEQDRSLATIVALRDDADVPATVRLNAAFRLLELGAGQRIEQHVLGRLSAIEETVERLSRPRAA